MDPLHPPSSAPRCFGVLFIKTDTVSGQNTRKKKNIWQVQILRLEVLVWINVIKKKKEEIFFQEKMLNLQLWLFEIE